MQFWSLQLFIAVQFDAQHLSSESFVFEKDFVARLIFLLRLRGQCSLQQISDILLELSLSPHSVGTISSRLQAVGEKLPNTQSSFDHS